MKLIIAFSLFLICSLVSAQKNDTAQFVHVSISHYLAYSKAFYTIECIARYSDGKKDSLKTLFGLPTTKKEIENPDVIACNEFKMLNYFYQRGYELLAVVHQTSSYPREFYFKHK